MPPFPASLAFHSVRSHPRTKSAVPSENNPLMGQAIQRRGFAAICSSYVASRDSEIGLRESATVKRLYRSVALFATGGGSADF